LETYADVGGVIYARKRMLAAPQTAKRLSILRQQRFHRAPAIDLDEMGVVIMPFIEGARVMAKRIGDRWEFGYSRTGQRVGAGPQLTQTPHDLQLLSISQRIQDHLGFRCEIEYVVADDGEIFVVQAKDISQVETLEQKASERSIRLDGVRRTRKRRNYRERPVYVMDNKARLLTLIGLGEEIVLEGKDPAAVLETILGKIDQYQAELEEFALSHEHFAVLGLALQAPPDLYQIANHYLDDYPELQKRLSKALYGVFYVVDQFLAEADTLIAQDKIRFNLCSHDAYGVDTVRNPVWTVSWRVERHREVVAEFKRLGFKTGDVVGIDIDAEDKPTIFRL
jgi:hypothetical protein